MALLNQMAQRSPIAGLLAQRRQQQNPVSGQGVGTLMPQMQAPQMQVPQMQASAPLPIATPEQPPAQTAPQQVPPGVAAGPAERRDGVGGLLKDTITGVRDPRLSEEENRSATISGLIKGGLVGAAALATGGIGAALIATVGVGSSVAGDERRQALERVEQEAMLQAQLEEQERLSGIYSSHDPFDPEGRAALANRLYEEGFHDRADTLMEHHMTLAELEASDRQEAREEAEQQAIGMLFENLDMGNIDNIRETAAVLTRHGMASEANALTGIADSILSDTDLEYQTLGGRTVAVDRRGEIIHEYGHSLSPKDMLDAINENQHKRDQFIGQLVGEWNSVANTRNWHVISDAAQMANEALTLTEEGTGPVGSVSGRQILTALAMQQTPGRISRESTTQEILASGGLPGRFRVALNAIMEGGAPDPEVIAEAYNLTQRNAARHAENAGNSLQRYWQRAEDRGIDPTHIEDPFEWMRTNPPPQMNDHELLDALGGEDEDDNPWRPWRR